MRTYPYLIVLILLITACHSNYSDQGVSIDDMTKMEKTVQEPREFNTEAYDRIYENPFLDALKNPQSTFAIDVDGASYTNTRRFLNEGKMPPKDAVRIEEFINYFTYQYPGPTGQHPFATYTEVADCPWNTDHKILHVGIQGKRLNTQELPNNNLVFLLDVSGSMDYPNKLPLLKSAFQLLVDQLDEHDRIAIVVYAGAAGQVLPSTTGDQKEAILAAINDLEAGGSTAGAAGIQLAYQIAEEHFIEDGNNRIILSTDGDFNVGTSSDAELTRLIEEKRESGIYLSVLGFGTGNYKDAKMEKIANNGNGNFYYIDELLEAKKVLVNEMGGTLVTIAKDVKIQLEFNPAKVAQYRLIGYENRLLRNEDFADDTKDAGELGAGHSVTALYEIVPREPGEDITTNTDYTYQTTRITPEAYASKDMATLRFRYKPPQDTSSQLIEQTVLDEQTPLNRATSDFRFAAAVAEFGLLLRDSEHKKNASYEQVLSLGRAAQGDDREGYRASFLELVGQAQKLTRE